MNKYVFEWGHYPMLTKEDYNREYPSDEAAIEAAKIEGADHVWTVRVVNGVEQNPTTIYHK